MTISNKGFRPGARTVTCQSPTTLSELVSAQLALERKGPHLNSLELIELGSVYVDNERSLNPARLLRTGELIRIHTDPRRFPLPADLSARIIAESDDTLLIDKPSGLPSEPTVDNIKENLLSFLESLRGQHYYLTHRLETETDGLILIAKNQEAQSRIKRSFAEGRLRRVYVAYVEAPVLKGEQAGFKVSTCQNLTAETNLITEGRKTWMIRNDPLTVIYRLEIEFTNARPKEIRESLAAQGSPIIGDQTNGSRFDLVDSMTQKKEIAFRAISLG